MGDKQVDDQARRAASEVLGPRIAAVGDLAVAAQAASEPVLTSLVAKAEARARQIIDDAHAEAKARTERWQEAHRAALAAGWTPTQLRAKPINQQPPPRTKRRKAPGSPAPEHDGVVGTAPAPSGETGLASAADPSAPPS